MYPMDRGIRGPMGELRPVGERMDKRVGATVEADAKGYVVRKSR